jgi:hypothetical protein
MKPRRPVRKQQTSVELRDELLRFIEVKFYPGRPIDFIKDRRQLLKLAVLKFAAWLDERGVTLPSNRYLEIVRDTILMEAVRFGRIEQVKYIPGWLGVVVEKHLEHHGEEYYEEAKSIRSVAEAALLIAGRSVVAAADPVRELSKVNALLKSPNRTKKRQFNDQLNLL